MPIKAILFGCQEPESILPAVLGHAGAGDIVELGRGVTALAPTLSAMAILHPLQHLALDCFKQAVRRFSNFFSSGRL